MSAQLGAPPFCGDPAQNIVICLGFNFRRRSVNDDAGWIKMRSRIVLQFLRRLIARVGRQQERETQRLAVERWSVGLERPAENLHEHSPVAVAAQV